MIRRTIIFITIFISLISCEKKAELSQNNTTDPIDFQLLRSKKEVNIDSLYQIISLKRNDTVKVNDLIDLFGLTIRNRPIKPEFLDEALKVARQINYETGIANALNKKGVNARYNDQYLKSLKLHKEALTHYDKSWDIKSKIKNLNSLGVTYRRLNIEEEAIKYYLQALELSEKIDFNKSIAIALNGIGNAFVTLNKYDEAIKYFNLALHMETLIDSERGKGYDYSNLGEAYMYKKEYDTAFYYHSKALEIANRSKRKTDKAIIYSSIGLMFQHKGELDKALDYYTKAIPILEKYKSKRLLSFSLINAGIVYMDLKQYKKAEEYITSGLKLAKEINSKDNILQGYQAMSDLFETKGKYKDALENYKLMTVYHDSIFNIQSENNMMAMNIKYDSEKKDQQIQQLHLESKIQKGRSLLQFLAIGFLILLVLFFYFYNRLRLKNQQLQIDQMRNNIEEYIDHISQLENEDCRNKKVDLSEKIEKYGLSTREAEVLKYISQGMKNQEIADKMFVSLSTIKTHTKNIFDKMDVRNRIEAVRKAEVL
ncbi:MAG: hypothetical protein DSY82_00470 [Flavobacteriia bacterium]|nr:MAG: hypothetical protein DSY82_00470 [Flavobacteriia bacterium]